MARSPWILLFLGLSLSSCGSSTEAGVEVRVVSSPSALSSGERLPSIAAQDLSVTEVQWTSLSVELVPCPSAARWLAEALVPSAHAHGTSTPTRLSVPTIEWASSESDVHLGTLRPPARRYCDVRYTVGAADADAVGIAEAPEMERHSLLARGFDTAGDIPVAFEIHGELSFDVLAPVELELTHEEQLTLRIDRDKSLWFDGVDLAAQDPVERARKLAENLRASITLRVERR